ncbi:aminotransferase class V-fold PLP-dependent enzyme [Pleionea mediterranea]|uniref:Selenocysteine lyase/cysteine desulfurase n=1 Tax=Pleionea mediterranea TaxID=523701 RepID=A0A316GBB2_9GAMM|nr:aminotransferase class V-fold PLP-dependent enzyme [Pleionea mediterranea]PWK51797.1 selenocysteine lyase/cysteine desulfurase [Pleionea mediterranea]
MTASYIPFNAAGASLCSEQTIDAQIQYLKQEQLLGGYLCAEKHADSWQQLYQSIGRLIGCEPRNIALQESATRGLLSALMSLPWQSGDEIVICDFEYGANYVALLQLAKRYQVSIKRVAVKDGSISAEDMANAVNSKTRLVLLTWVPSHNGVVCPAEAIGQALMERKKSLGLSFVYAVDACQAVGQMPVDVAALACDFLCATGRKFLRAPRGTGFLYVSDELLEQNYCPVVTDHFAAPLKSDKQFELRDDAKRFELWEANWSARMGLKVAVEQLLEQQSSIYFQLSERAEQVRSALGSIDQITLCDTGDKQSAIITFYWSDKPAKVVYQHLLDDRISSSVVTPDAGLLDLTRRQISELNRVSVHTYNDESDIEALQKALKKVV